MGLTREDEGRVIHAVQRNVPLADRPFRRMGEELGLDEAEVIGLLKVWNDDGRLREISGILEGAALGYDSALIAGSVPDPEVERVAGIVSAHPTVTHNYLRKHRYNLWYTVAVPEDMGLDRTVAALSRVTGVRFHVLRRTTTFKIGVNFDVRTLQNRTDPTPVQPVQPVDLTERSRLLFRALQVPLPIVERPFELVAPQMGVEAGELVAFGQAHLGGAIRRYVGTLRHRKLGVRANPMVVWKVPEARVAELGARLAEAPEVSHCYARNPIDGFPYALYSMIHGPDLESCERIAARISRDLDVPDYALLVSVREYKKARLRYFLPELDDWWGRFGAGLSTSP